LVICDFDGTITLKDSTDLQLDRFADPAWLDIEKEWLLEKIRSRECLERQLRLVQADEEDLISLHEEIPLDPAFSLFAFYCREENIPLAIASDSFDFLVTPLLQRQYFGWIPAYANRLRISEDRLLRYILQNPVRAGLSSTTHARWRRGRSAPIRASRSRNPSRYQDSAAQTG